VKALGEVDGHVLVSFSDEGPVKCRPRTLEGISSLFTARSLSGTGLGLSIVYRIVHEHQGRIRVKSRRGSGTEVQGPVARKLRPSLDA